MTPEIEKFLTDVYGINASGIEKLEGYDSENYKITSVSGDHILKFYPDEANIEDLLTAENDLLTRLSIEMPGRFPKPQPDASGNYLVKTPKGWARLLSFVDGAFLANAEHSESLFYSFGKFLAEMDWQMLGFRSSAIEARKINWDLVHYGHSEKFLPFIDDSADRKLVEYFFLQNRERVEPQIENLRFSVIHNDANDWNVLVDDGAVSGIIDFGDMCYTPLINELVIAVTYAVLGKDRPVEAMLPIIRGYHDILPLEETEIEVFYWLVATRLGISVCNSAKAKLDRPDSEYITISEKPAWELLRKWIRINPVWYEDELRKVCGFESKITDTGETDLARRQQTTSKALSLQFSEPIKMSGAAFQYMFDARGNSYLDCYNNIPQVGHCHPRVVEAGQRAMARLNTNTRYLNDIYNEYAENLLAKFPSPLTKVFFLNSGSAASDLAIRVAMTHTKNQGIVVMEHGYHGNTRLGIDISHYKYNRQGGSGKPDAILEAELPDTYKGRFTENDGSAGKSYAADLFARINENGIAPAAFIAEPIVGCGGQVPLANDYLKQVYPFIRQHGGVCISDEVQTGFGRLGEYFWGFEMHGVVPDIVVMGKPMGNGHPMAAVVTTDEIAESFETGMEFFSSFGGNPVSCAIGQAVLDVLDEEKLPENAREVGGYLLGLFEDLVEKHEVCGDARGEGLFLGLEFVTDKKSKNPNTELASTVQNKLRENGILTGTDGPFVNVLKIKPPICFTKENADDLASEIENVLMQHSDSDSSRKYSI
ncbi:MAG: aminotransferase class III-fold pyridoxal phosphate-dependent enzyme [Pyrinomonadaceae bacterium]